MPTATADAATATGQLPPAAGALGEVRLEPRLILARQRIEGIEG